MVLARLPNFLRQRDHWSPCSNTSPPAASLSPAMAHGSPAMVSSPSGLKAGFQPGLASPTFSWGSIFGFGSGNDLTSFTGLTVEDNAESPASSASGSAGLMMPLADVSLKLPAWCSEDEVDHSSPEVEEVAPSSVLTPSRKLRRTGRLGRTPKTASGPRFEPSSPDIDEGADFSATRSFFVDPYLHPTPANRPLRQYVSAPELSEHQQQQIMAAASASARTPTPGGLASSASMDDLLLKLGWPGTGHEEESNSLAAIGGSAAAGDHGARQHQPSSQSQRQSSRLHPQYQAYQESRPSSSSSAGRPSGGVYETSGRSSQRVASQSTDGGLGEIDGSLYLRRQRQTREGEMPNPSPIDTSSGPLSGGLLQRRSLNLQDARSAPLLGASPREQQRVDLQQLQLQSSALQTGNADRLSSLFGGYLQESDSTRQSSAATGLGALGLNQGASFDANQGRAEQPGYGPHYLLYSDPTLQTAPATNNAQVPFGYTSTYPASSPVGGVLAPRPRRHTMARSAQPSTAGQNSSQLLGQQHLQPMSAEPFLWPAQHAVASPSTLPTANQLTAYTTPRSTQPHGGNEAAMTSVSVFVPAFADPWNATPSTPSTSLSAHTPGSLPPTSASSAGFGWAGRSHRPLLPNQPHPLPPPSTRQARKIESSPNLQLRPEIVSAPLPSSDSPRKIAGTRRVQSSRDLRDKAKRSPDSPLPPMPSQTGGSFSFVNYGIEDAQELCSAVAPSGSYKIPLKGYGGPAGEGPSSSPSSSSLYPSTPPRVSSALGQGHKAPSAVLKNKTRPRVKVDNSRWIQETGEDSEGDSDSEELDEEMERRVKRQKSGASPSTPIRNRRKAGA